MKIVSAALGIACLIALLFAPMASAAGTACFDWICDPSTGQCSFNGGCSTASPYVYKYNFDFGDGSSTGISGNATHNHTYAAGVYGATVQLTIQFTSSPTSDTVSCNINTRLLPIGPQPPPSFFQGRCSN